MWFRSNFIWLNQLQLTSWESRLKKTWQSTRHAQQRFGDNRNSYEYWYFCFALIVVINYHLYIYNTPSPLWPIKYVILLSVYNNNRVIVTIIFECFYVFFIWTPIIILHFLFSKSWRTNYSFSMTLDATIYFLS